MSKHELIVPSRTMPAVQRQNTAVSTHVQGVNAAGPVESMLFRWRTERHTKSINALTVRTNAEVALQGAQTQLIESTIKGTEALVKLHELPERLGHELAVRRVERAESYRQVQRRFETNELTRLKEVTHAQAEYTHAKTVLVDAEQQLKAQRENGYYNYELMHQKKTLELLDLELSKAERKALFKKNTERKQPDDDFIDDIDDALYSRRDQLNAAGLDTSRLDAAIRGRKNRD